MALEDLEPQLPRFTGSDPNSWISQSELYFRFYSIYGDERFSYVIEVFEDEPFYWFNSWFRSDDLTWNDFTTAMIHRFCSSSLTPTVNSVVNLSPPLSALKVFDEMPDSDSIEHGIAMEVHEIIADEVLEIQTESLVDVNESRGVKDAQLDIWDYIFVLDSVIPSMKVILAEYSKDNAMVDINVCDVVDFSIDSLVIPSFPWNPGLFPNHVQVSPTPTTTTVVYVKHSIIGSLATFLVDSGWHFGADWLIFTFGFDPGLYFINHKLRIADPSMGSTNNAHQLFDEMSKNCTTLDDAQQIKLPQSQPSPLMLSLSLPFHINWLGMELGYGMVPPIRAIALESQSFLDSTIVVTARALQHSKPLIWAFWTTQLVTAVQSKVTVLTVNELRHANEVLAVSVGDKRLGWKGGTIKLFFSLDDQVLQRPKSLKKYLRLALPTRNEPPQLLILSDNAIQPFQLMFPSKTATITTWREVLVHLNRAQILDIIAAYDWKSYGDLIGSLLPYGMMFYHTHNIWDTYRIYEASSIAYLFFYFRFENEVGMIQKWEPIFRLTNTTLRMVSVRASLVAPSLSLWCVKALGHSRYPLLLHTWLFDLAIIQVRYTNSGKILAWITYFPVDLPWKPPWCFPFIVFCCTLLTRMVRPLKDATHAALGQTRIGSTCTQVIIFIGWGVTHGLVTTWGSKFSLFTVERTVSFSVALGRGARLPVIGNTEHVDPCVTGVNTLPPIEVVDGVGKPLPPMLFLHIHYGGFVGAFHGYDVIPLGGACSVRGYNIRKIGAFIFYFADSLSPTIPLVANLPTPNYFFNVTRNIFTAIRELNTVIDCYMTSISEIGSRLRVQSCTQFITSILTDKDLCVSNHFTHNFLDNLPPFLPSTLQQGILYPHFGDRFIELSTANTLVMLHHFTRTEIAHLVCVITFFAALHGHRPPEIVCYILSYFITAILGAQDVAQVLANIFTLFSSRVPSNKVATKETKSHLTNQIPTFHLEDKVNFKGGGNVMKCTWTQARPNYPAQPNPMAQRNEHQGGTILSTGYK